MVNPGARRYSGGSGCAVSGWAPVAYGRQVLCFGNGYKAHVNLHGRR